MNKIVHEFQTYPSLLRARENGLIANDVWENLKKNIKFTEWLGRVSK